MIWWADFVAGAACDEHGCTIAWQAQHLSGVEWSGPKSKSVIKGLGVTLSALRGASSQHCVPWRAGFVAGAVFGERRCTIGWQGQRLVLCKGTWCYTARPSGPPFCVASAAL